MKGFKFTLARNGRKQITRRARQSQLTKFTKKFLGNWVNSQDDPERTFTSTLESKTERLDNKKLIEAMNRQYLAYYFAFNHR